MEPELVHLRLRPRLNPAFWGKLGIEEAISWLLGKLVKATWVVGQFENRSG